MKSDEVKRLQEQLAKDASLYPEGLTTGYFGSLTEAAVKRLQQKHGLPQTGIVDTDMRNSLSGISTQAPINASPSTPSLQRDLVKGARGDDVKTLQSFLKAQGFYPIVVTGYFGSYTLAAVKEFQKKYGLPATGAASALTREKIRIPP